MRMRLFVLASLLAAGALVACRDAYKEGLHERERAAVQQFMRSRAKEVWEVDGVFYGPVQRGDSLVLADGDTISLQYTLYALSGSSPTPLATNILVDAKQHKLPMADSTDTVWTYIVGKSSAMRGFDRGLRLFAQRNGTGWLGIPSRLAYGESMVGVVKPNTPVGCFVRVLATSGKVVQ